MNEQEKQGITKEREDLDREVKKYMEEVERIKSEQFNKKKGHQNDLLYQITEKEKQKTKEIHDKFLEERSSKLLEIEYLKKIDEHKLVQFRKVNLFKLK